jgi:hypothetical protein
VRRILDRPRALHRRRVLRHVPQRSHALVRFLFISIIYSYRIHIWATSLTSILFNRATKETADEVGTYAADQAKFFTNYAIAHVRMAHVGCEACGVGTDLYSNPCAAYDGGGHHGHHLG